MVSLRTARESANLTQAQLAARLGVDSSTVRNWETGRTRLQLSPSKTLLLCTVLGVTLETLIEIEHSPPPSA